jgi:glucose/arabinose dehydrogenase
MRRAHAVFPLALALAACGGADTAPDTGETATAAAEVPDGCEAGNGGLMLPAGFCAVVVADDLGRARHLTVAQNGDIYVRLRTDTLGGGIVALRDTTGDGRADVIERFESSAGTGIVAGHSWLWFTTDTEVFRVAMPQDGALVPTGSPQRMVSGFPAQRSHAAKPIAFDGQGALFVTVGGPTNACQPVDQDRQAGVAGEDPCSQLASQTGVWRFDANTPGQVQGRHGAAYAVGIRNAMALDWNSAVGALYVVQHGRDMLDVIAPDHFTAQENATRPGELLYRVQAGDTLHHPYCFWDLSRQQAVLGPEYGGDGEEIGRCADFPEPLAAYPAHWAPNDLKFYDGTAFPERFRGGAFIAFHGSWNRAPLPMGGYIVAFQPMRDGEPAGEYEVFADGFTGAPEIGSPGDAEYRPMGLAIGPDGALYISDSQRGRIWRVRSVEGS